jgi:hypothetical protein
MFWPGAETRADRYQGTLCSALVLAALRAAPRLSRPTDRHQTRNRSGNAGPRHAVIKSATTKINYKTRETATFWAARNGQQRHCCRVGARDPVTSLEQLLAELTSEAAADASDKPCVLCHLGPFA